MLDSKYAVNLFYSLLELVLLLADNGCYHTDIKPSNIVIYKHNSFQQQSNQNNPEYQFKVINFGTCCTEHEQFKGGTELFYYHPVRNIRMYENNFNKAMRLEGEIFTIIRTLQYLMLTKE